MPIRKDKDGWAELERKYQQGGIVLALGAGVSVASGLPNWPALLKRLASRCRIGGAPLVFDRMLQQGLSLPVIASVFETCCARREDFVDRVRDALYEDLAYYPKGVHKGNRRAFVRDIKTHNPTLHAAATLCAVPRQDSNRYEMNPRLRGVVTFNLDGLLQAYVYARFERRLVQTIERASATSLAGKIPVYHMHGFLRFDSKAGLRNKEAHDAVVLTEQDYYSFFNDPTSLFNYTFLYLLREATCVFLGLSMQDENVRRMLHISRAERIKALGKEGVSTAAARNGALRHFAVLRRSGDDLIDAVMARALQALGTQTLWVDGWDEVPQRFRHLYESTGQSWKAVE